MMKRPETTNNSIPNSERLASIPLVLLFLAPVLHMCIAAVTEPQIDEIGGAQVIRAYRFLIWQYPLIALIAAGSMVLVLKEWRAAGEPGPRGRRLCAKPMLWLGILALLMILSTCVNGWTVAALHGLGNRQESLFSYLVYIGVYFWCGSRIRTLRLKRGLLYFFLGTALFAALCTLGRGLMGGFPGLMYFEVYAGPFYNLNHYAYYLVMVLLASLVLLVLDKAFWGRSLAAVCFCVNLLVLMRNGTLGGLVALFAGMAVLGILLAWQGVIPRRYLLPAAAGAVLLLCTKPFLRDSALTMMSDLETILSGEGGESLTHTGHNRMGQWLYALELIREKPWLGWGVEGAAQKMAKHTSADRVHSEYLYYALSFGVPALLCYLAGLVCCFLRASRREPFCLAAILAAFGYAVSACFGVSMFYTAPFFFVFLGLGQGGSCRLE